MRGQKAMAPLWLVGRYIGLSHVHSPKQTARLRVFFFFFIFERIDFSQLAFLSNPYQPEILGGLKQTSVHQDPENPQRLSQNCV